MKMIPPVDSLFLYAEHRRQPMHVAGLNLFTLPEDAPPDFIKQFVETARDHALPKPPYNQRPVFRGAWFWHNDEEFDLDHHLRHLSLPQPGRIRELLAMVSRLHGSLMDRGRPLWEFNVIEGLEDGRMATFTKVHHSMFDGVAAMRESRKALSNRADEYGMPPPWARTRANRAKNDVTSAPATATMGSLMQSLQANSRILPGAARGVWDMLRRNDAQEVGAIPYQAPPSMLNVSISSSRRFAAQSYSLARLKAVAKASNATLNDIALAMCSGALREYLKAHNALPNGPLITMVPVSIRAADSPEGGNQVSVVLVNLATHILDPAKRLRAIIESTQHAKQRMSQMSRMEQLAYAAGALSPMFLTSQLGYDRVHPAFNLVISNVPGPTETLYWNGARLDEMYPVSIPIDGQALNITLTSYCDQMAFGYTACRRSVPSMQRLLDYTEQALVELEAAAGV